MLTIHINENLDGSVLVQSRAAFGLWESARLITRRELIEGPKGAAADAIRQMKRDFYRDLLSVVLVGVAFASLFVWGWSS